MSPAQQSALGAITVLCPEPILRVTLEVAATGGAAAALAVDGRGVRAARMARELGARVTLCAPFGGGAGHAARALVTREGLAVRSVAERGDTGIVVDAGAAPPPGPATASPSPPLHRDDIDALHAATVTEGLRSDVTLLSGAQRSGRIDPTAYRRIAADLRTNGAVVVADVAGRALDGTLAAGVDLLRVGLDDLREAGRAGDGSRHDIAHAITCMRADGAREVVVTRGERPAIAWAEGRLWEIAGPRFEAAAPRGAGDALCGAIAAGLARGGSTVTALRLGAAAGALAATRRGRPQDARLEIEALVAQVRIAETSADALSAPRRQ